MTRPNAPLVTMPTAKPTGVLTHPGYQQAGSFDHSDLRINDAIRQVTLRHVARHLVPALSVVRPPRFLVVQGVPGEGKTHGIRVTLSRADIDALIISSAELAGETENAGVAALERIGSIAHAISAREGRPLALVLDDFDLSSVARLERVEYTVSSQLLTQHLQFIADTGALRTAAGVSIPIVMTGNDFTPLRASLLRPGRATFFQHQPSFEEKCASVGALFPSLDPRALRALLKAHRDQPIAFFADLKTHTHDHTIDALIQTHGLDVPRLEAALTSAPPLDPTALYSLAAHAAANRASNFFTRR